LIDIEEFENLQENLDYVKTALFTACRNEFEEIQRHHEGYEWIDSSAYNHCYCILFGIIADLGLEHEYTDFLRENG